MVKLEALMSIPYGVGTRAKGEIFEAPQADAAVLVGLKRARLADGASSEKATATKAVAKKTPTRKPAAPKPAAKPAKPKAGYNRRDMKAK